MAIVLISGPTSRYIGTEAERSSMDPKPVVGAEYFESDTGLTYVFCGDSTWTLKLYPAEEPAPGGA